MTSKSYQRGPINSPAINHGRIAQRKIRTTAWCATRWTNYSVIYPSSSSRSTAKSSHWAIQFARSWSDCLRCVLAWPSICCPCRRRRFFELNSTFSRLLSVTLIINPLKTKRLNRLRLTCSTLRHTIKWVSLYSHDMHFSVSNIPASRWILQWSRDRITGDYKIRCNSKYLES